MITDDADYVTIFEAALDVCVAKLEKAKDHHKSGEVGTPKNGCPWQAMRLTMCMSRELFVNCPAKAWTTSKLK